ncbi:MAG: O-antigen ligase C-terminal domain-containing protein, partial [Candidatus Saccharibacteria bacterium]|nr:O-antigen ligase C-terminal domain-containing protein [Moraxellaceae bacterium]
VASSALAGFLIFGVALTQSRTPWIGALFFLGWWAWKSRYFTARLSWFGATGWVVLFVGFIITLPLLTTLSTQGQNTLNFVAHVQSLDNGRGPLWQQFILAVFHGPLWGYGWNQVSVAQLDISNLFPLGMRTNSSHNILLDLLVWNGPILGSVIILSIAGWLCRLAYSARTLSSLFAFLAVGFALIHGMLEFPLTYAYFLLPVGLLIGMIYGELSTAPDYTKNIYVAKHLSRLPKFSWEIPKSVFASFIVICSLFMAWIGFEYNSLNREYRTFKPNTLTPSSAPLSVESRSRIILLTQLRDYLHLQSISPTPNMTQQQLDWTREVAYRFPQVANLSRYATALALNNQPIQAGQELGKLRILYGNNVFTHAAESLTALQQQYADQNKASYRKYWRCQRHPHGEGCL